MVMDDLIDTEDLMKLDQTPFEWITRATDADLRSSIKENTLSIIVFVIYFYLIYMAVALQRDDPSRLWPWLKEFMFMVGTGFCIAWAGMIRWKGGSDVWEVDFYRADGTRATGIVLLDGQPQTVEIEYLIDSTEKLRQEYERVKQQRIKRGNIPGMGESPAS